MTKGYPRNVKLAWHFKIDLNSAHFKNQKNKSLELDTEKMISCNTLSLIKKKILGVLGKVATSLAWQEYLLHSIAAQ